MIELTDEQVVAKVKAGDANAYGELILRYEAKLRRYARRFLRRPEDIDDGLQEVFVKAYTNIWSFDQSLRFSPWIYRIAHNTFINESKRHHRGFAHLFDFDTLLPQLSAKETADGATLETELSHELEVHLDLLDVKYREPIILYFFESLSYQEIAEVLHIPVTTVGVRMKRGKEQLRRLYEEAENVK